MIRVSTRILPDRSHKYVKGSVQIGCTEPFCRPDMLSVISQKNVLP